MDTNGDGYRDFAFHLNGSSGSPSEPIDRVVSIYSSLKNNSLDYKNNAAIKVITHTPAAFIDLSTNRILNFQNSLSPLPLWPNGSAETVWDYGTTRSVKLTTSSCTEFFIDYQLPIGMLDATSVGGPAATKNTPLSLAFATANSLQNPFQKDMVCNGPVIGDPNQVACFGDPMTFEDGIKQQPWILEVTATSCGPTTLLAKVLDSTTSDRKTTVNSVDFYYYYDANQNEIADDGYTWTFASSGTLVPNTTGYWTANWNSALLLEGKYLIGATATDTQGNKTWSYLTQTEVNNQFGATPPNYANPTPTPGIIYGEFINYCGTATPSIIKSVNPSNVLVGETVTFTLAVSNTTANILTINTVTDTLPPGFSYLTTLAGTLGTPSVNPTANTIGTIAWQFSPAASVPAFNTRTLIFTAKAAMDQGTYVNIAAAKSGFGLLQSNPVSIGVGVPRLTLSKQANRLVANPGELVSYTLRYANDSPINTTNVIITDVLPLGMSFFSAAQGGIYISATRTISWVIGSIAPGDGPYDFTFVTKVDNPYPPDALLLSENTATITSNETFPQTATATVIINAPRPSLLIQKDSAVTQVPAGGAVPFTITYANAGNSAATNVVITDIAPAGFTILGASVGSVTTTTRVTWTLASVAAGASGAVTVTMRVSNPFTQTNPALNYAWISSTQTSPIFDDFWEGVTQFTQICSNYYFKDDKINVGVAGLQYPAVLTAPVPSDIGSVITVTTPVDLSYIEVTRFYQDPPVSIDVDFAGPITTSFWIDRANGPPITISSTMYAYNPEMGAMAFLGGNETSFNGNQKGMLNFVTNASGTLPAGSRLLLIVNVKQNTGGSNTIWFQFDGTAINVYSGGTTFAPSRLEYCVTAPPNLVLNKQVSSLIAIPGDSLTYTIKFANIGQTSATGSVITDVLPTGTSFITASLNGAPVTPYFVSGQTYAFNVNSPSQATGVITSAVTGTLSIAVKVSAPLTQSIDMLLNAVALGSTQTLPKYDTALTAVLRPDTSISKFSDKTLLNPGDVVTFSLVVQNSGVVTATNVTLSDTIPATPYFTYVLNSARHNGTVIAPDPVTGALLYYNAGALGPNAALTVTFQMSVSTTNAPNGLTYLSNMAAVTDTQTFGQRDSDPVIVTISTNPNLRVSKSVTPTGPLDGGALVTYTLTVTNIGGGDALDLFIRDAIPTNTNYVNGSLRLLGISQTDTIGDDNGEFDANVSEVVFRQSVLLRNSATYAQFTVRTDRPLPSGITPITNYVTAGASNAFPKSANVTVEASAMPILTISKSNKGLQDAVPYPATYLAAPASGAMVLQVVDSYYLSIGQYISINGQVRRITNLTDTLGLIEVNSPVTAAAGSLIAASYQYEVRFGNIGDAVAYTTVLTDYLPANTIFVTATQGGDHSGGIVTWSIDSLTSDADGLVEITVIPTTTGIYTNTVVIDSGQTSPLTATAQTPVGGLNVSKLTTTPMVVQTLNGTRATYVISVVNVLPFAVSGVIITDALAAGYSYLQTLDVTGFSANSPVVTRTLGAEEPEWGVYTIPANGTLLITFTASISDTVGRGYYDNEVNVSAGNANVVQFDALRSSTDDVLVLLPEFNLVKRVLPAVVTSLGGPVTYTLVALNYTEGTATTTTITDTLPPGFYYLATDSITASSGVTRTAFVTPTQGDTMPNWGTWTVDAGHALTITFTSFANTMSGVYTNTALLVSDNATATVTNTTVLVAAPTVLTGIVRDDVTSQPIPGATVVVTDSLGRTYTTTTNASGAYTFTSTITNPMSSGLAAVAASAIGYVPAQYATTVVEGIVNIQDIDLYPNTLTGVVTDTATGFPIPGATVIFTDSTGSVFVTTTDVNGSYAFTSTVAQPIHTGAGNVASSHPGYETPVGYNPSVTIVPGANVKDAPLTPQIPILSATKLDALVIDADANSVPSPGDTVVYTIVVTNSGNGPATGVFLNDLPDANTTLEVGSVTTSQGTVITGNSAGNTSVAIDFGTLPARSQMTITFRVLINIPLPAGVTQVANQGIISSNELPAVVTDDPDTPQGSDPTVTPVVAAPVLGATKADALVVDSDGNGVASPGDTLVYTVTIVNTGNSAATGVVFYDTPGAYTTLVTGTVTTTQGNVTNGNGAVDSAVGVNVGTIPGNGGLVRITFRVKIMYPVPAGVTQVANQGTVASNQLPVVSTDDPDTLQEGDPTVTPLTAAPIINSSKTVLLIVDADNNKLPSPGDTLLYQVQIQNSGNKAATGVVFTDTPGANTTLVTGSVQTTFGTVTSGNGAADSSVGVNIGTIQGGGSIVFISFRVKIANPLPAGVTQVANQGIVTNNEVVTPTLTDDPTTDPVGDPTITPVTAAPLLSAVKTVLPSGTALPGENLLYQITLVNNGNVAVSGVVFTDTPGANTTLVTGSVQTNAGVIVSGNANGQTIVGVNVGTIPGGGGTVQISFLVKIVDPLPAGVTQVANQGVVGTNELPPLLTDDPRTTPVGDPTVTPVSTFVQLALAKTVTPTVATPGGLLTYTISYGVTGNTVAVSVTVRDAVPANTTYESCSGAPCSQSGGVVVWTLGNKAPPNSGNVTLVVRAVSPLPNGTLITNTATITEASGQSAQAQVVVPVASSHQLAVSKSAVPSPVSAGGLLTYTIAYTVAGNEVATGVVLNDVVPANTTYQSCTGGVTCGINGSTVRWSLGNLSPSANGAVTLVVRVNTPLISGTQVVNNVTITDTNNGGTAQAQVTVPVVSSHVLEVSKRATPSPVSPNGLLTYTIAYTVTGNEPAPGVTLRDVLPVNTSFVACVDVPCSQSGGIVTWILGMLNPPANGFVTFVVRVTSLLANGTLITNTVSMTDTSGLTTTGQVVVPVVSSHQLAVSKNAMPSPVAAGGLLTYTIMYTVTGNEPAVGVTLNDALPANTSFDSCSGAPCGTSNGSVIWNLGNLNPVTGGMVTLVVRVGTPLISGTQIVNNVTLTDTNGGGTAQAQAITPVVSSHQIAVSKSATPSPVAPGGLLTYTIAYTVTGNEPAQGVTLRDTIPANTTYVDCLSACTLTGGVASWNLGTLNPPTNGTVTLVVRLNTPLPNGTLITNTVSMTDTSGLTSTGQVVVPVVSSHLLQVSKSAASPTVIPGGLIVYTIIYTVTGNEMANGVTLTDALPANTSFDSCPTSLCNVNNGVVTWNLGNITPPVNGVVTLIVKAADVLPNNLPITNTVTLFDTSGQTVNAQAIVNVVSSYVLTVNKTASTAPVNAGDLLTYTINYTVTGNAPATGVSVKDTLPTNTTFVSCNGSPCSQVNGAVVWNIGNVNPPANGVLTLVVRVAGVLPNGTLIINTVLVSDTTGITNTNTVTTPVASSHELAVLKTATPSPVEAGGLLTYTIVYSVTGNEPANGVVLTDALPANTTFQSCAGAVCGFNNGAVTWSLGNLTPPTFGTVQLVVRVTSPLPSGTLITNSVTIGDASGQTAQSQVVVPVASSHQIAVTKSASPSTAVPGSLLIYTIQYTVTGNEVASSVTLVDNLPAHTSFVNCAGAPCAQNNGKVTWSLGNLTPPTFGAVTLIVQVADVLTNGLQIANSVFVSDTTGITNTSTVTVPVVSSHALTVTKTADAQTTIPGSLLTYTIAYTVTGNAPAAGLTVIDTLPANTTYVSCGGAPCSQTNGSVVWTLGTIKPPADGLLTLVVRIADVLPNGTPIVNTVLVSDTTGITNTDTVTTPVVSSHQLTVLKQASASVVEPGDQLTYTMQYTVTGNEPAPNVIITDVLPANVIPVSCNPVNCQAFLGTVSWNLGTIIPPASGTVMVVVQVSSDVISGTQLVNSVVIVDETGVTNTNTITTPVLNLFAALNVHKTAIPLPGSTVKAGDLITYTITVTNYGNIPATNVVITDAIPAETEYVAGSATPEPFSGPDPLVWTLPSLPPYQPYAVSFTVRVLTLTNAIVNVGTVSGDGLPPVPTPIVVNPPVPSAVTLSNFNAQVALEGTVTLSWMTTLEIDTAGFNILRSTDGSRENAVVINVGLIPTQPGSGLKEYAFADADIQPNVTYSYWLQEVETGGGVNEYGPVSATRQTMKRIYMPFVLR